MGLRNYLFCYNQYFRLRPSRMEASKTGLKKGNSERDVGYARELARVSGCVSAARPAPRLLHSPPHPDVCGALGSTSRGPHAHATRKAAGEGARLLAGAPWPGGKDRPRTRRSLTFITLVTGQGAIRLLSLGLFPPVPRQSQCFGIWGSRALCAASCFHPPGGALGA